MDPKYSIASPEFELIDKALRRPVPPFVKPIYPDRNYPDFINSEFIPLILKMPLEQWFTAREIHSVHTSTIEHAIITEHYLYRMCKYFGILAVKQEPLPIEKSKIPYLMVQFQKSFFLSEYWFDSEEVKDLLRKNNQKFSN